MTRQPRLPRHRPSPGQLVIPFHYVVIDGGGMTAPGDRPALRVLPGGLSHAPAPTPVAARRVA